MSVSALAVGAHRVGPLHRLGPRTVEGQALSADAADYWPLVPRDDLELPAESSYEVVAQQGRPMGAFPDTGGGGDLAGDTKIYGLFEKHDRANSKVFGDGKNA